MPKKTADDESTARRASKTGSDRPAASFLVRFWLESEESEISPPLRGYARNLDTSEERYFGDPKSFVELVRHRLRAARQERIHAEHEGAGNVLG